MTNLRPGGGTGPTRDERREMNKVPGAPDDPKDPQPGGDVPTPAKRVPTPPEKPVVPPVGKSPDGDAVPPPPPPLDPAWTKRPTWSPPKAPGTAGPPGGFPKTPPSKTGAKELGAPPDKPTPSGTEPIGKDPGPQPTTGRTKDTRQPKGKSVAGEAPRRRVPLAVRLIPAMLVVAGSGVAAIIAATNHTPSPPLALTTSTATTTPTTLVTTPLTTSAASSPTGATLETVPPATRPPSPTTTAGTTTAATTTARAKAPASTGGGSGSGGGGNLSPHTSWTFGSLYDNSQNVPLSCNASGRCTGNVVSSCVVTNPSTCATTQSVALQFTGGDVSVTDTYRTTITPSDSRTCHGTGKIQTGHPFPYATWARGTWTSCVSNVYSYPTEGWTAQAT